MSKQFKGKALYCPQGRAAEYSKYAANFFVGCSGKCSYCYNRNGITAKILGGDTPTLKKSLVDEDTAYAIFRKEVDQNLIELQEHGLHFNFVSDPCLTETWALNSFCMRYCIVNMVPVKILTKQTWWLDEFIQEIDDNGTIWNTCNTKRLFAFGFTLTGHDEMEPGCATNGERIRAMRVLHDEGFKTWASIEPIIDIKSSMRMIDKIKDHVDLIKVGLESGKTYSYLFLGSMAKIIIESAKKYDYKVYFKDSFVKQSGLMRVELKEWSDNHCVEFDYNIFKP